MNKGNAQRMKWREAVEFLFRLAGTGDPASLREGDRINLIDDLWRFLEVEGQGDVAKQLDQAKRNPALLKPVIEVVRQLATGAADHERTDLKIGPIRLVFDGGRMKERADEDRVPVFSDGPLRDVVADIAAGDLGEAESWQIGRCQWADCNKLFLADRKGQIFCSHKCANSASSARYQERKKSKERRR